MTDEKGYTEGDWKLFRKKIVEWQEAAIGRLNEEYIQILSGDGLASEKFREVEKRIRRDQRKTSLQVDMRRSRLLFNIGCLLDEGTITLDDLEGFSDGLRERMAQFKRF